MKPRRRWSLIALTAIGTAVAGFFSPGSYRAVDIVSPGEQAHAAAVASSAIELPRRRLLARQRGDLFQSHSWEPPAPPPPPQQEVVAAPQPPPNPYRFAGSVQYGGSRKVLLTRGGDRVFEVAVGEVLEPGFRVQAVTSDAVTLLYEPMNAAVTVALVFPPEASPSAAAGSGR
ncbi:MAG TPA: hypothetical protein VNP36_20135 [Burkholderiales bacterium]|nr:hypothetical protein [Burkholderiales bacterium]